MRRSSFLVPSLLLGVLLWAGGPPAGHAQAPDSLVRVRIATEVGDVVAVLYAARAPATVANFLRYVDAGHYAGGSFFRTVRADNQPGAAFPIAVVQAGVHPWQENFAFPPVPLERTSTTGLRHRDGALSMARGEPDSATSSFFICVGDQPALDSGGGRNPDGQGFAVFGQVVEGMDVVARIHGTRASGQAILPPVRILSVERVGEEE